jgi:sugar O-acyltransferase (sialic acid O-acetyltransferase NeuD family)
MKATYGIYSAGGFAREVKSHFLERISAEERKVLEVVFIDDDISAHGRFLNGCRVISYDEAKTINGFQISIAFADPALRRLKYLQAQQDGFRFFSIAAMSFYQGDNVLIGDGAILCHNAMITSDARVGKAFHLNIYSYVAHDCDVGDFVTISPRVSLNGRIRVEDDVYIGSAATFLPGRADRFLTIGKGAVIGANALVTKDVPPGVTVVGAPAKPLGERM